jgi:hypothetical protein
MAATDKLKWQRLLNELRYQDEEHTLTCRTIKEVATEFELYYRDFCVREQIDRDTLNKTHANKLENLYGKNIPAPDGDAQEGEGICPGSGGIARTKQAPDVVGLPEESPEPPPTADEIELHDIFNKLFRKIAMQLHPDKVDKDLPAAEKAAKSQKFKEAKDALNDRKYFILLQIADEYNIKTPRNYRQQSRWMKREIEKIKHEIQKRKSTYNYLFADAETDDEKDTVIRQFMNQLFGIKI